MWSACSLGVLDPSEVIPCGLPSFTDFGREFQVWAQRISWEPRKHGDYKKGFLPRGDQKIIPSCSSLLEAQRLDFEPSLNIGAKSQESQATGYSDRFSRLFSKNSRKGATRLVTWWVLRSILAGKQINLSEESPWKITLFGHVVPQHGKEELQTADREGSGWLHVGADPHVRLPSWSEISFRWESAD